MDEQQARQTIGQSLYTSTGEEVGTISHVYLDEVTRQPEWVTVQTHDLFGTQHSLVPIDQSQFTGTGVQVPYDVATIKDAAQIDADEQPSEDQEADLYRHYGQIDNSTSVDDAR